PEPGKFRVSYNGNFTVNMPDLSDYNLMNSTEKLIFEKEAGRYTAYSQYDQKLLDSLYNKNLAEVARGVDTYWLNEPTRASFTHKHNVYAEGGDDAIRYGLGLTYNNTQGVMKNSGNDLLGINFDLTYRVGKFQFSNKLSVDYLTTENPTVKFNEYANANPYYRKRNADGSVERYLESYLSANGTPYTVENPLYNASLNSFDNSKSLEIKENLNVEWKIMPTIKR
ncbi:MAG: SusC/RagA family TonB-linked outer membrane protein, partial [Rikenellaceae bacterium]